MDLYKASIHLMIVCKLMQFRVQPLLFKFDSKALTCVFLRQKARKFIFSILYGNPFTFSVIFSAKVVTSGQVVLEYKTMCKHSKTKPIDSIVKQLQVWFYFLQNIAPNKLNI